MSGNGGPWGGGGGGDRDDRGDRNEGRGGDGRGGDGRGGRRPGGEGPQIPEIEEIMKKGQEQLRVLMGGRGRSGGGGGGGGGGGNPMGPMFTKQGLGLGVLAAAGLWAFMSFYTVKPEERSVELFLGKFSAIGKPGLNFAPWPLVKAEIVQVTGERQTDIGTGRGGDTDTGLMLTRDQNIVDIEFQVVWNVSDPSQYLFNLKEPTDTIRAVAESAMRDIIARSELSPVLNRDRGVIASDLRAAVQGTLDSYQAGISVVRVNFDKADPPREVIDSFREVQAAQQERDRLEKEADAYANRVTAGARGEAARLTEQAEGYRAEVVNNAQGEASRFLSVYAEYVKAPDVTRRRMYLETMEKVLGNMNKVILDGVSGGEGGQGVVPFLPLNDLNRMAPAAAATTGTGNN
ncbi:MAG: FtsH protease activity modulator HflK [Paracoccaceae bacterium]|nr:FtsH protease activity modulator HflK [Paracoccaceae bacterium]